MTMDLAESARQREEADFELWGDTPRTRRLIAEALVIAKRRMGKKPEQWVVDVAEGRLPA